MELWIRTQNKKRLFKVNNVYVVDYNGYYYVASVINGKETNLGEYGFQISSRALEVLDEIQNIILLKDMYEYDKESLFTSWENISKEEIQEIRRQLSVYEMPKE